VSDAPSTGRVALELRDAADFMAGIRAEIGIIEDRLRSLSNRARKGERLTLPPIWTLLRASADRLSDRSVAAHDLARRVEDIGAGRPLRGRSGS
jgi:hypothetical protein